MHNGERSYQEAAQKIRKSTRKSISEHSIYPLVVIDTMTCISRVKPTSSGFETRGDDIRGMRDGAFQNRIEHPMPTALSERSYHTSAFRIPTRLFMSPKLETKTMQCAPYTTQPRGSNMRVERTTSASCEARNRSENSVGILKETKKSLTRRSGEGKLKAVQKMLMRLLDALADAPIVKLPQIARDRE